jgi:hypothetical protein
MGVMTVPGESEEAVAEFPKPYWFQVRLCTLDYPLSSRETAKFQTDPQGNFVDPQSLMPETSATWASEFFFRPGFQMLASRQPLARLARVASQFLERQASLRWVKEGMAGQNSSSAPFGEGFVCHGARG